MKADVRAQLEATAAGKKPSATGPAVIAEDLAKKHADEFTAWARFSVPTAGERLAAPAELLTPLP